MRNIIKTRRKHIFLLFPIIIAIGLCACTNKLDKEIQSNKPSFRMPASNFPGVNLEHLVYYIEDEEFNCPIAARTAAIYELLQGGSQLLNSLRSGDVYTYGGQDYILDNEYQNATWSLTEEPRPIFDFDGTIKYYEYGLIEDDEITAIITVYAKREAPCAIAYIFPYVLPYNFTDYDYYVGQYPHRVFYDGTGYRFVDDITNDYGYYLVPDEDDYWTQLEAQATSDEMVEIYTLRQSLNTPNISLQTEIEDFWNTVDYAINENLPSNITEPCFVYPPVSIVNTFVESLKDYLGTSDYCRDHTATPYCDAALQQTHWNLGCGPAALSWIYRGLYYTYPPYTGAYLPLHGDYWPYLITSNSNNNFYSYYEYSLDSLENLPWTYYSQVKAAYISRSQLVDNGLAANFFSHGHAIKMSYGWQYAIIPCNLDPALDDATNGDYGIMAVCAASTAAEWIEDENLPVIIHAEKLTHYLAAYGFGGVCDGPGEDIRRKDIYFLVTDNGNLISNHNYKPFWRRNELCEYYYRVKQNN